MAEKAFDVLARRLWTGATRRAALGGALTTTLSSLLARNEGAAKGKERGAVSARRKRRKKKRCVPNCDRRICGPDGCGGICGNCSGPTICDGQGRCAGCIVATDCPSLSCQTSTCDGGICRYTNLPDGTGCTGGSTCCDGSCTDTGTDEGNCGVCGNRCSNQETCRIGACGPICDVCTLGCAFTTIQDAIDAAAAGGIVRLCPQRHQGAFEITKDLVLEGVAAHPSATMIDHPGPEIIDTGDGVTTTLRNLTVTGMTMGSFGAIRNRGTMRLERVRVVDNRSSAELSSLSGGILNAGAELTLVDCVVRDNRGFQGGGITNQGPNGTLTLIRTDVEFNQAENPLAGGAAGGGIFNANGTVNLTDNSRVRANTATGSPALGGGVFNFGPVARIELSGNSSITGNAPDNCVNNGGGAGCP